MHNFDELIFRSSVFTLKAIESENHKLEEEFKINASTIGVKNLQTNQLQKAIIAIGMFSLFDSILQEGLSCRNGFEKAKKVLVQNGKIELNNRFNDFICAINVLKHGRGNSYNILVEKYELLPFRIKLPWESFFNEGDVSEVSTLIEVDDKFVLNCAELIEQVSKDIRDKFPDYCL